MNTVEEADEFDDKGSAIISDLANLSVDTKQVYKNKSTLMEAMRHYAVVHKF